VPPWYPLMRAARWMRVAPWDLQEQPVFWRERALTAEQAEGEHQQHLNKQAQRRSGRVH